MHAIIAQMMLAVHLILTGMGIHVCTTERKLELHVLMDITGKAINVFLIKEEISLHLVIKIVNGIQDL
jgi:multisubunit Na+/H+ antiporter MnhC subunit